jgi:hypothetical protein
MPHAVAEFAAAGDHPRPLELELEREGLSDRTVLVRVTSLLTVAFAVAGTDMCAFVPPGSPGVASTSWTSSSPRRRWLPSESRKRHTGTPNATRIRPSCGLRQLLYDVAVTVEDDRG